MMSAKMKKHVLAMAAILLAAAAVAPAQEEGLVTEVRVHGNFSIADDEVVALAGVKPGDGFSPALVEEIKRRLLRSGRFEWVDVRVRYKTIGGRDVALVIVVRESVAVTEKLLFGPLLTDGDGYGLTYGARVALVDSLLEGDLMAFPLTWGGIKQAALEYTLDMDTPVFERLSAGAAVSRRRHPYFEENDDRLEAWLGMARRLGWLYYNVRMTSGLVSFGETEDDFQSLAFGAALDTRSDSAMPGDAFRAGFSAERLLLRHGGGRNEELTIYDFDLRGYRRLVGQSLLAACARYKTSSDPLPPYRKPFLGGPVSLRGHRTGSYAGDRVFLTSLELRLPLTGPAAYYRAGWHVFFDAGTAFDYGVRLRDADFHYGAGLGAWVYAAVLSLKLDLAHDLEGGVRLHLSTGFAF